MPPRLVIIADDLTGALDSAAPFAAVPGGVRVATCPEALDAALAAAPGVLAVSTRSREIRGEAARERVAQVLAALPPGAPVFKKVDSRLKGNVAAELAPFDGPLLVLPAIPDFGRLVRDGALTGFGVDHPLPVAGALGEAAARATVPDTLVQQDMAAALAAAPEGAVLVGARGLAQALAARWGLAPVPLPGALPSPCRFVVGSTDPITTAQVAALRRARPGMSVVHAPSGEVPSPPGAPPLALIAVAPGTPAGRAAVAARFAAGLRPWLAPARGALLTGGATAEAVLDAMELTVLELAGEALPGLPLCRVGERVIVTKSGGFGDPEALVGLAPAPETAR
jgi:uncharacterized protein YgbK (DUF1537 family)